MITAGWMSKKVGLISKSISLVSEYFPMQIIWKGKINKVLNVAKGPLITDGWNCNEMRILSKGLKVMKICTITKCTPSYFPALINMAIFDHFSLYRDKIKNLLFIF